MALKEPESMDDLIYFTKRSIGNGSAKAWVYKQPCPKCGKAQMGKPRDEKTGDVKIRAKEYVCPACKYTVEKKEYEESLNAEIKYVCPKCKFSGEIEIQFKRKKVEGVDALVFKCQKCNERILVTKKLKTVGSKDEGDDE